MIPAFTYHDPKTLEDAVGAYKGAGDSASLLAGGTDLVNLMKDGIVRPEHVVNLKSIPSLSQAAVTGDGIELGATMTLSRVADHGAVKKHLPALAAAAGVIAGPQIRNMGTLGGNLCQKTRCWYYRNGLEPESMEETQYHAIFANDEVIGVNASTLAPVLIAYGARVLVLGPEGERTLDLESLYQPSGPNPVKLKAGEIITKVIVPVRKNQKSGEYQVRERLEHDWPLVQAAVAVTLDGDTVREASILLGHVAPTPYRAKSAEAVLKGKAVTADIAAAAGIAASEGATPLAKNAYKVDLVPVAVKRALMSALGIGNRSWEL